MELYVNKILKPDGIDCDTVEVHLRMLAVQ